MTLSTSVCICSDSDSSDIETEVDSDDESVTAYNTDTDREDIITDTDREDLILSGVIVDKNDSCLLDETKSCDTFDTEDSSQIISLCDDDNCADLDSSPKSVWNGFKIVGDNLDKLVKSRYMRLNKQNRSLNFFNSFAVKDRINLSSFSSFNSSIDLNVNLDDILPSATTHLMLTNNITVLVSRILVKRIPTFKLHFEDHI